MAKNKGPRILRVYPSKYGNKNELSVVITAKQFRKLPEWVQPHINWMYPRNDDDDHREIAIEAKDELQAMTRFKKLWAALSTIGE